MATRPFPPGKPDARHTGTTSRRETEKIAAQVQGKQYAIRRWCVERDYLAEAPLRRLKKINTDPVYRRRPLDASVAVQRLMQCQNGGGGGSRTPVRNCVTLASTRVFRHSISLRATPTDRLFTQPAAMSLQARTPGYPACGRTCESTLPRSAGVGGSASRR